MRVASLMLTLSEKSTSPRITYSAGTTGSVGVVVGFVKTGGAIVVVSMGVVSEGSVLGAVVTTGVVSEGSVL